LTQPVHKQCYCERIDANTSTISFTTFTIQNSQHLNLFAQAIAENIGIVFETQYTSAAP